MKKQIFQFALAGVAGFLVDAAVLYLALWAGLGYFAGRIVSFTCAVFATWRINRRFTFASDGRRSTWGEWWRYLAAMAVGGVVNYVAYSAIVVTAPPHPLTPLIAVGVGSIAAMSVNFATAKLWVFRYR